MHTSFAKHFSIIPLFLVDTLTSMIAQASVAFDGRQQTLRAIFTCVTLIYF